MANSAVILLLGSLALLALTRHRVSAGARNRIEPIVSNVYYLQDYCSLPPDIPLEEKYRHRRSSDDSDHDHDHDSDNDSLDRLAEDIHKTVKYYAKQGYRKVKEQIKREMEFRKKWKQVFLDPISQPSIVVRLWRPHDEYYQEHHRLLEEVSAKLPIKCNILLRMSSNSTSATLGAFANSTLGAVVNFLKLNKKPWLNNYRLRIVSSDPNMTQYWLQGRKLTTAVTSTINETKAATGPTLATQIPVAVDLVTNPKMYPEPLQKEELEQISSDTGKWLLIELETLNQVPSSSSGDQESDAEVLNKLQQTQDNTELVINLYAQSTKTVTTIVENSTADNSSLGEGNETIKVTYSCPVGTFDCAGDGSQCIPSGLRCNGEDNCGNRFDELFNCGTVNLYYIFGSDSYPPTYDLSSDGFWFAVRIIVLLFLICLLMYTASLLCRCCCPRGPTPGMLLNGQSPMIYVRSAKSGNGGSLEPLLSNGSNNGAGFGATAGRAMKNGFQFANGGAPLPPSGPPPSYFGNQSDNQKSNVNEYIYVNNNYGQPQGSTTVNTTVRPSRDNINGGPSAPPQYQNDFPPLYPNIEYPNYGGTQKS